MHKYWKVNWELKLCLKTLAPGCYIGISNRGVLEGVLRAELGGVGPTGHGHDRLTTKIREQHYKCTRIRKGVGTILGVGVPQFEAVE
jgi:hypothetical protein